MTDFEELRKTVGNYLAAKDTLNAANPMKIEGTLTEYKAASQKLRSAYTGDPVPMEDNTALANKEAKYIYAMKTKAREEEKSRRKRYIVKGLCALSSNMGAAEELDDGTISVQLHDDYRPFILEIVEET